MNRGYLTLPTATNSITIENKFNDVSTRSILYSGQLFSASDPALKDKIVDADLALCTSNIRQIPLKRYTFVEPYLSTFQVQDVHRLGVLTTDIEPVFPKSVQSMWLDCVNATVNTVDSAQIRMSHYGVTQHLIALVSTLEDAVLTAQRNGLLS
jgi:hypothetical protein